MSITQTLIQAIELQNSQRLPEAAQLFESVLAQDANNAAALYSLGIIAMNRGESARAFELAERGVRAAPAFAPLHFLYGTCLQGRGQREQALASYDQALRLQPDLKEVLVNSGVLLRAMFRHKQALERFNRVLALDPNHAIALANCGVILTEFKQSAHAIAMFERLVALRPDYDYAPGLLFYERAHLCDWRDFEGRARGTARDQVAGLHVAVGPRRGAPAGGARLRQPLLP
jgi:tetratricopeptide (TPR) repeat protein